MRINGLLTGALASSATGGEVQVATALTNRVGVMVNGYAASHSDYSDGSMWSWGNGPAHTEKGSGSYLEAAVGWFRVIDARNGLMGEVYGGYGMGTVTNDYGFGDYSKVNCFKVFVQPAIGYKNQYVELAFVPKLSFIHWWLLDSVFRSPGTSNNEGALLAIQYKPTYAAFEPAVVLRAGTKVFKLETALSFSTNPGIRSLYNNENLVENLNCSIGISINLGGNRNGKQE